MSRQEKRKESKKQKRKQQRQQAAFLSAQQQQEEVEVHAEAVIQQEREEDEALARERAEHDEQERLWLLREEEAQIDWLRKQEEEKEAAERKRKEEERRLQSEGGEEEELEEGWEYVEDGPAEIIWQGNEIIVKKPRKKVRKGTHSGVLLAIAQDKKRDGPISNPLPPQSTAFSSYQADTQDVADQSTNFGTEKDQRNCPFYIKTGVCLFGVRCSRLHPVFNEACTLLMRSMYTGAGLALDPVESLEYTDEEVVQEYEEFYDDVHSEFIQFGEIVNFKVCRNSSPHLRGNVYVHYVSQESAMAAYNHMNGRFYAKKQISCEFVGVRKWKLAICGEFMRTYYKTCSRGTSCNFLHCFENPRGEYEWADMDRPPPRFWQRKMAKLFGHARVSDEEADEKARTYNRESSHDTDHRRRHREVVYDDDRRRSKHTRDSRGERERKLYDYSYEDESKDRTERASSKYNDRHRGRRSQEKSRRREKDGRQSTYEDDSAKCSLRGDEPGCINDERWIAGDDHPETDDRDRRRERRHRSTIHDEHDDHPGRYSPTLDHVYHHRSSHHGSTRRSRSPSSRKARRSRSRDRSTSHMARSPDGNEEEQEDRYLRPARHRREIASKESKHHRHTGKAAAGLDQFSSDRLDTRGDDEVGKSQSFDIHPGIERHQRASKVVELDDVKRKDLAGMLSEEIGTNVVEKKVSQEGSSRSGMEISSSVVDLSTDEVQKSTSEWQSWRKTTKVKLGLKEKPMRLII